MKAHIVALVLIATPLIAWADQEGDPPSKQDRTDDQEESKQSEEAEKAEEAMESGNELFSKGRYKAALAKYEAVLALDPDREGALFNAGLSAYLAKSYRTALRHWKRSEKLAPSDWVVHKKLVQTFQALGDTRGRDAQIKKLYALRAKGEDAELAGRAFFCRDQFAVKHYAVSAYEHFELKGKRPIRIYFVVEDTRTRDRKSYHLSLGSYEMTNLVFQQRLKKEGKPPVRLYHLDGYEGPNHETWQFYAGDPDYDLVRGHVREALESRIAEEEEEREAEQKSSAEDAPSKDTPGKDTPGKDTPGKDAPKK